jgi:hypothetical protein
MLRYVTCPRCSKKLRVDDASGLTAGKCPACGQKFRMPWAVPAPAAPPRPKPAPPAPEVRVVRPAAPAQEAIQPPRPKVAPPVHPPGAPPPAREQQYPVSIFSFEGVKDPAPLVGEPLLEAQIIEDDDDEFEPADRPLRRKKKKRRPGGPGMSLEMSNFLITLGVLGMLWLLLSVMVFFKPDTWLVVLLIGGAFCSLGWSWLVRVAFEDGAETGLLVMFVPLYSLLYLVGNLERAGKPYAIRLGGFLICFSALVMMIVGNAREAAREDHPRHFELGAPRGAPVLMPDFNDRDD